jgi:hypothetical protein
MIQCNITDIPEKLKQLSHEKKVKLTRYRGGWLGRIGPVASWTKFSQRDQAFLKNTTAQVASHQEDEPISLAASALLSVALPGFAPSGIAPTAFARRPLPRLASLRPPLPRPSDLLLQVLINPSSPLVPQSRIHHVRTYGCQSTISVYRILQFVYT